MNISSHIESMLFVATSPVSLSELKQALEVYFDSNMKETDILHEINMLKEKCAKDDYIYELVEIAGGYTLLTKARYHKIIEQYLRIRDRKKLSPTAIETLAIVAYRQPVTKAEVDNIRGVSSDYGLKKLLDSDLIEIVGRSDQPGKPLMYGTSEKLLDYFGLDSIKDLPKWNEIVKDEEAEPTAVRENNKQLQNRNE